MRGAAVSLAHTSMISSKCMVEQRRVLFSGLLGLWLSGAIRGHYYDNGAFNFQSELHDFGQQLEQVKHLPST